MPHGLASGLGNLGLGGDVQAAIAESSTHGLAVVPEYLAIRVTDIDGNVIIPNLPHPHRSRWEVRGFQGATGGNSNVGSFELPLYEPWTAEGMAAAADYALLSYDQRIEAYMGDVIAGRPRFSGIVREIDRAPDGFKVRGASWDYLLQLQKTTRGEPFFGDTRTLARAMTGNWEELWSDDFSSGSLAAYSTASFGSFSSFRSATDPLTGFPAVLGSCLDGALIGGTAYIQLLTNQTFPQSAWDDCMLEALIHFTPDRSTLGPFAAFFAPLSMGRAGIVIDAGSTDGQLTPNPAALLKSGLAGPTDTTGIITPDTQVISGGLDLHSVNSGLGPVLWAQPSATGGVDVLAQLIVQGKWTGTQYIWRMLVNGVDCGVTTTTAARPTGGASVGLVVIANDIQGPPNTGPTAYFTNFVFRSRAPRWFQLGSYAPATKTLTTLLNRASQSDLLGQTATIEGYVLRSTPAPGADVIDWGPGPVPPPPPGVTAIGADLSHGVVFREAENLVNVKLEPNAETLATDIELTMGSTTDTASIHWTNIPAARQFGVLTDFGDSLRTGDVQSDIAWARTLAQFRGTPGAAKTIEVLRDTATADRWREMDYVTIDAPRLGLRMAQVLVVGYDFVEGDPTMTIVGDQFPISRMDPITRRWWGQVAALSEGAMAISPSSFTTPFDSTFGQPQTATYGNTPLAVSGLNWGPLSLARALVSRDASFLFRASLSWSVTGTVAANFTLAPASSTLATIISPDGTAATGYTAGDGGPVDVTNVMQGQPGWFEIASQAATGTGGTGTVMAQLTLFYAASSAL